LGENFIDNEHNNWKLSKVIELLPDGKNWPNGATHTVNMITINGNITTSSTCPGLYLLAKEPLI